MTLTYRTIRDFVIDKKLDKDQQFVPLRVLYRFQNWDSKGSTSILPDLTDKATRNQFREQIHAVTKRDIEREIVNWYTFVGPMSTAEELAKAKSVGGHQLPIKSAKGKKVTLMNGSTLTLEEDFKSENRVLWILKVKSEKNYGLLHPDVRAVDGGGAALAISQDIILAKDAKTALVKYILKEWRVSMFRVDPVIQYTLAFCKYLKDNGKLDLVGKYLHAIPHVTFLTMFDDHAVVQEFQKVMDETYMTGGLVENQMEEWRALAEECTLPNIDREKGKSPSDVFNKIQKNTDPEVLSLRLRQTQICHALKCLCETRMLNSPGKRVNARKLALCMLLTLSEASLYSIDKDIHQRLVGAQSLYSSVDYTPKDPHNPQANIRYLLDVFIPASNQDYEHMRQCLKKAF